MNPSQEPSRVVHVEIHGQRYSIRSSLDPTYVTELAAFVDEKMRLASKESPAGDTLKTAVLAAINIADEYFRACDQVRDRENGLAQRAGELERLLDLVLAPAGDPPLPAEAPSVPDNVRG